MTIEICTVGGYNEVGKNMTAIRVDDEVVIIDMGLHLDPYIKYTDDDDLNKEINAKILMVSSLLDNHLDPHTQRLKHSQVISFTPSTQHIHSIGKVGAECTLHNLLLPIILLVLEN